MVILKYTNKKALESQKKIYKGLRRLLEHKCLSEITVTDISVECNISRTTFYRNFNNVVDILDVIFDYYYYKYLYTKAAAQDNLLYFFEYWFYHRDLVNIITNQSPNALIKCINTYSPENIDDNIKNIKFEVFSIILSKWSQTKNESPQEMAKKIKDILTKKYIDILIE